MFYGLSWRSSTAEQLICNQQVVGSNPIASSRENLSSCRRSVNREGQADAKLWLQREGERFPSGQREQTVNLPAMPSKVRILPSPPFLFCGNSSVGRARAFQARGRGFESRFPLQIFMWLIADWAVSFLVTEQPARSHRLICPGSSVGRARPW
jgi:hypothetical protein